MNVFWALSEGRSQGFMLMLIMGWRTLVRIWSEIIHRWENFLSLRTLHFIVDGINCPLLTL